LTKEKSSGKLVLREKPFKESSQKKHDDPFPTVAIDIPLKAGKSSWGPPIGISCCPNQMHLWYVQPVKKLMQILEK